MAKKVSYYESLRAELGGLVEQLQLPELYKAALKRRWLDQVVWADKKADQSRRWHYRLRLTTIVGGVILPALVGINFQLGKANPTLRTWFPYFPFFLSQVIAVSAAVEEFCRFGDRWRDYRQMSENLKAEGWQYLQSSGSYQGTRDHESGYALFASRVESIIKDDVQNYISELVKQQSKQDQAAAEALESANTVARDRTLFAQPGYTQSGTQPGYAQPRVQPGYAQPGYAQTGYPPMSSEPGFPTVAAPGYSAPHNAAALSGAGNLAAPTDYPPRAVMAYTATASAPGTLAIANSPFPVSPSSPQPVATNLNAAIVAAAASLHGMSTADGPDGGNNACAWTVNKVLQKAGIAPLGENPNYVPAVVDALKGGRGQVVSITQAKAGDLVVACGEAHIGIGMTDGCSTVLSNSSSKACFQWESDPNFDGYYSGSSTVYRLIR